MSDGYFRFQVVVNDSDLDKLNRELKVSEQIAKQAGQKISAELAKGYSDAAGKVGSSKSAFTKAGQSAGSAIAAGLKSTDYSSVGKAIAESIAKSLTAGLGALKSGIGNILQGVFQGIGQSLYGDLKNAFSGIFNMNAYLNVEGPKSALKSLGQDAKLLQDEAKKATKELGYLKSQSDLLKAAYPVASSGFSGKEAMDIVKIAAKASVAAPGASGAAADVDVVGDAITTMLNSYQMGASEAEKVASQMIGTVNAGKIELEQYASLIGQVASVAAAAGVPLDELNTIIASSTVSGVKASSAMAGIRAALAAVAKPSEEAKDYVKSLGLDLSIAAIQSKGFVGVLKEIQAVGAATPEGITQLFGSVEAWSALQPVIATLDTNFQSLQKTVTGVKLDEAFKDAQNSANNMLQKIGVLQTELDLQSKTALAPIFEAASTALSTVLSRLNESGDLFAGLNAAAIDFRDYLNQNPEIVDLIYSGIKQLLDDGLKIVSSTAKSALEYLKQNPDAISDSIKEAVSFTRELGKALQMAAQMTTTIAGWSEGIAKAVAQMQNLTTQLTPNAADQSPEALAQQMKAAGATDEDIKSVRNSAMMRFRRENPLGFVLSPDTDRNILADETRKWLESRSGSSGSQSGSGDQYLAAVLSILEAPSRQGRVDVAQVLANRVQNNYGGFGKSIRDQAFASGQFEPFFGVNRNSIQDRNSAIRFLQEKRGMSAQQAEREISQALSDFRNPAMASDSASKVGNRAHFKGTSQYKNMVSGEDFLRQDGENFFHYDGSDRGFKTGSISALFGRSFGHSTLPKFGPPTPTRSQQKFGTPAPTQSSTTQQQPTKQTAAKLYPTILTGTIPAQEYGVDRGGRRHAGQDFDLGDSDSFRSYIGGRVTKVGNDPGGYFKYIDIFNEALQRVERIAELDRFNVKEGDIIQPGQVVGQGTNATGVVHYEIRSDMNAQGQGGYGFNGTEDPVKFLEKLGIIKRQGNRLEPTGASLGKSNESFEKAQEDAIAEARQRLQAKDRSRSERLQQERKQRDQQIALQESQQDNDFSLQIASVENPQLKAQLENQRSLIQAQRQVDAQIRAAQDELADLKSARSLKVSEMKLGGSGDGVDYTSAIKQQEQYIAGLRQQREEVAKVPQAEWMAELKKATQELTDSTNAQNDAIADLNLQYEQSDTPAIGQLRAIASINDAYNSQKQSIEETIKALKELNAVAPSADLSVLIKRGEMNLERLAEGRQRAIALSNANFEKEQKEAEKQKQIEEISTASDRRNTASSGQTSLLQGKISLGNLLGTDTSDLQKELALIQEQLRFESAIDELKKLELAGNTSAETLQQLYESASQLNSVNLEQINQQFSETRDILQNQLQSPLKTFLSDLLTGTKTIGEAFQNLISSLLSSLAQLAVNKLFTSLFGGLFGGGGGGGLLGIDLTTPVFNFASGGEVPAIAANSYRDGYGKISEALKKEGSNSVLAALTPGELILSVRQSKKFKQLGMDRVLNFADGGIVPGASMPSLSMPRNSSANITLNVASPQQGVDYDRVAKMAQLAAQREIMNQQRPKGLLDR